MSGSKLRLVLIIIIVLLSLGTITNGFLHYQKQIELANLQNKANALENDINQISTNINQIATSLSTLNDSITRLSGGLSSLDQRFGKLSGDVSTIEGEIQSLRSKTSSLLEQVTSLNEQTKELDRETASLKAQSQAAVDSINKVLPNVVHIHAMTGPTSAIIGSGVIMRPDGYILTNKHLVRGATSIEVTLRDMRTFQTSGVWMDSILDLAVIKINGENLPTAQFGDYRSIVIGEVVIALGYPLGLSPKEGGAAVTTGIVSNLDRSFRIGDTPYYDVIQIDAAINPGNSGGPL